MKKQNINEQIIDFLLSLNRENRNHKIVVSVNRDKFNNSKLVQNLTESDFLDKLSLLENDKFIALNFPVHKDLKYYIEVTLEPKILHYYEEKERQTKLSRKEFLKELRAWITLVIAIAGFILSVYSLHTENQNSNSTEIETESAIYE